MTTEMVAPMKLALETSRLGARARAKLEMSERLRATALELFLSRGYDQVPVSEIAEKAGVTSRTFFRHFPTKETVLLDVTDQTNIRLIKLLETVAPAAAPVDTIKAALLQWFTEFAELLPLVNRLSSDSENLRAGLSARQEIWQDRISGAIGSRFVHLAREDARLWGLMTFVLLRLTAEENAGGLSYPDALAKVFYSFQTQTRSI
ncbi:TetR/AcrR family transcriptional regulator [Arthrobacter sp. W4I7]|uniref:TetR/AcrR family transcriptional regulator n=1 Tax=Arthrobacter sp. W4I7 TaxID=3042296 RepID=UPI00278956C8|nr:TetR/AcrR family transcriptional regulator [Arthrobacter sp. W4I7]MDQ0691434.1 AcrR family transcriptional regulator [Arthrobacter sp. W4I7]